MRNYRGVDDVNPSGRASRPAKTRSWEGDAQGGKLNMPQRDNTRNPWAK